ncbi:unnamed protein product [Porites evermanni]|uniref:Uncharacterized protein n=1 Tax=Porites evermanni TaxID=104178 RepID=A0ABN8SMR8_9CNID|nr:unnamed protein product [Porites evermanni]
MVKSSLCVKLRKRCVALCFKKLLELWGCRGKVLNLMTKGPLYVYHFLRMSTSFHLFWPSKLFCCFELGNLAMPRKQY